MVHISTSGLVLLSSSASSAAAHGNQPVAMKTAGWLA
jgi:hypothetical protein